MIVSVWLIDLELPYEPVLSPREVARASRFLIAAKRRQFESTRTHLRRLLGAPATQEFAYTDNGKPYFPDSPLKFNVSHSENRALIAIAQGNEVGVDIEFGGNRQWSLNEAYIKARGWAMPVDPSVVVDPQWKVLPIEGLPPGYVGAVCAEGQGWQLELKTHEGSR
jgi:phosphopantetheinyl transferase